MEAPRGHVTETSIRSPRGTPIHRGHLIQTPSFSSIGTPTNRGHVMETATFSARGTPIRRSPVVCTAMRTLTPNSQAQGTFKFTCGTTKWRHVILYFICFISSS